MLKICHQGYIDNTHCCEKVGCLSAEVTHKPLMLYYLITGSSNAWAIREKGVSCNGILHLKSAEHEN